MSYSRHTCLKWWQEICIFEGLRVQPTQKCDWVFAQFFRKDWLYKNIYVIRRNIEILYHNVENWNVNLIRKYFSYTPCYYDMRMLTYTHTHTLLSDNRWFNLLKSIPLLFMCTAFSGLSLLGTAPQQCEPGHSLKR